MCLQSGLPVLRSVVSEIAMTERDEATKRESEPRQVSVRISNRTDMRVSVRREQRNDGGVDIYIDVAEERN